MGERIILKPSHDSFTPMFRNLQQFSTPYQNLQIYDLAIITVPSVAPPYLPKFIFHKLRQHGPFQWLKHLVGCSRDREDGEESWLALDQPCSGFPAPTLPPGTRLWN